MTKKDSFGSTQKRVLSHEGKLFSDVLKTITAESLTDNSFAPVDTGFENLNNALGSGIFPGITVIGGVPGCGKTSLALQIIDNAVSTDHPVLFFSLEMSAHNVAAKAISRRINGTDCEEDKSSSPLFCARDILFRTHGTAIKYDLAEEITKSANELSEKYNDYLRIYDQSDDVFHPITTDIVIEKTKLFLLQESKRPEPRLKPLIVIDYLQLLALNDLENSSMIRTVTDTVVSKLTLCSRNYQIPILLISSINRESYDGKPSMRMFKESGLIEYNADCLIGLSSDDNAANNQKRKITVSILKNRFGATNVDVSLYFYPARDFFEECLPQNNTPMKVAEPAQKKNKNRKTGSAAEKPAVSQSNLKAVKSGAMSAETNNKTQEESFYARMKELHKQ